MIKAILVINAGSSSIKFAIYNYETLTLAYHGEIRNITESPTFIVNDQLHAEIYKQNINTGYVAAFGALFAWCNTLANLFDIIAVGHRIVHGGNLYTVPLQINQQIIDNLRTLIPLAPLHQPHNLEAVQTIAKSYPDLLQVACFDTAFHHTQLKLATQFAIRRNLTAQGIIRYGFHGLSYEYIASVLPEYLGKTAGGKIIIAHLGNGASMCAMHLRRSVATSMGFTALDGLMMGTRCGTIDPGILLYLLQEKQYSIVQLQTLLYEQSGLLGVSNLSNDVAELEQSKSSSAIEALELFCFKAAREVGSLITVLRGCDAIVFTAGIGEHSSIIRQGICQWLDWLGLSLNTEANINNRAIISDQSSKIMVVVIPTNEEFMLAQHTKALI